ncbi:MAG TPA: hypothetical protein VFM37_00625 [Pseudonocardiaceae bacterium]|nr:hypothetical protein [Pseudonocardiaceae bacterium]
MAPSSRQSKRGAGWAPPVGPTLPPGSWPRLLAGRFRPRAKPFKWVSFDALSKSYNDLLTRFAGERIVHEQRRRWLRDLAALSERFPDLTVDRSDLAEPTFVIVGDPGEGDASQYCVAAALRSVRPVDFMVLCSDVIYPAGDVNDYPDRFYVPYADFPGTIYGLPGNHDWYDLLHGFHEHFCDARSTREFPGVHGWRERIARLLWRPGGKPDTAVIEPLRASSPPWRASPVRPAQPGPYYAIDTGPLRLVCIDTGVRGELDAEQGEWLRRVSAGERPKVLLTGRPLLVDYAYRPGRIAGGEQTVDDIVRDPANHYVAAIGGDIHNYQHYPVDCSVGTAGRRIEYVVSGGGGAYMSATHGLDPATSPRLPDGVGFPAEDDIRLYPLRGDSLAFYARQVVPFLRRSLITMTLVTAGFVALALLLALVSVPAAVAVGILALPPTALLAYLLRIGAARTLVLPAHVRNGEVDPDVAASWLARRYRLPPRRKLVEVPRSAERVLELVMPLRQRGLLVRLLSEVFDSDEPPFFKHFLLVKVRNGDLVIECRSVTGWADAELNPPVEDRITIRLDASAS